MKSKHVIAPADLRVACLSMRQIANRRLVVQLNVWCQCSIRAMTPSNVKQIGAHPELHGSLGINVFHCLRPLDSQLKRYLRHSQRSHTHKQTHHRQYTLHLVCANESTKTQALARAAHATTAAIGWRKSEMTVHSINAAGS